MVCAEVSARLQERPQLRWLVDRMGQPGGRAYRKGNRSRRAVSLRQRRSRSMGASSTWSPPRKGTGVAHSSPGQFHFFSAVVLIDRSLCGGFGSQIVQLTTDELDGLRWWAHVAVVSYFGP